MAAITQLPLRIRPFHFTEKGKIGNWLGCRGRTALPSCAHRAMARDPRPDVFSDRKLQPRQDDMSPVRIEIRICPIDERRQNVECWTNTAPAIQLKCTAGKAENDWKQMGVKNEWESLK